MARADSTRKARLSPPVVRVHEQTLATAAAAEGQVLAGQGGRHTL